ncbi:MAG: cell wall hydrolase/autolysin, partial [Clostridiaceae bacterium]|nr:cell wall hydrolase/autolysin [Clostridiaceae bacterium]
MQTKEKIQIKYIMSFIFLVMLLFGGTKVSAYSSSLMCVDTPLNGQILSGDTNVKGWALNSSGVKEVDISVDGQNFGSAAIGQSRPDVATAYPGYINGTQSGFSYNLSTSNLQTGSHSLVVKAVGNDGSVMSRTISISVQKPQPLMCVDTPTYGQSITGDTNVKGWTLNPSGVREVDILVDGQNMGTASIAQSRPDVAAAYPTYINGGQSGFSYTLSTGNLQGGSHSLMVRSIGNDGSTMTKTVSITVQKPQSIMWIDTPTYGQSITGDTNVKGWALNPS